MALASYGVKQMNWDRGLKRVAYFLIGFVWLATLAFVASDGPFVIGQTIAYLLFFTLAFILLYAAVRWVVRGFLPPER